MKSSDLVLQIPAPPSEDMVGTVIAELASKAVTH